MSAVHEVKGRLEKILKISLNMDRSRSEGQTGEDIENIFEYGPFTK
jgi:hypothetical protein